MKPFVNDFRLNLFDYHSWKDFGRFKTANRLLFEALSSGNSVKRMKETLQNNPDFGKLDMESAKAISGMLGVKINIEKIKSEDEEGRVVYNMCKAFDDHKEEGRREGRREGKREGKREGELEMVQMIKNLMKNQKVNFDDAAKILGISKSRQKKLSTLM